MPSTLPQANPTLDKMAQRVALAGTGDLGPILRGFGGRVEITVEKDETLQLVRIFSFQVDNPNPNVVGFNKTLASGTYTPLGAGRRVWGHDVVFGTDTDYGFSGSKAVRNFIEWTIRKRALPIISGVPQSTDDDRPFFEDRTYQIEVGVSLPVSGISGLTFREDEKALYVVTSGNSFRSFDRDGLAISPQIALSALFNEPYGIAYMGSDRFAVLDRGVVGVSPPAILLFHFQVGDTAIDESAIQRIELSSIVETSTDRVAGIAYDQVDNIFFVGTTKTDIDTGGLWLVDPELLNTDGERQQTQLFTWYDAFIQNGTVQGGAVFGDVDYARDMADGLANDSIFCLFRNPTSGGPGGHRIIAQANRLTGSFIDSFSHNLTEAFNGLTFDSNTEDMFVAADSGATNFIRYEHSTYVEDTVFRRQFFVKDIPLSGALYLHGQEAQLGESIVFANVADSNIYARDVTFSINILPVLSDEFFLQHEYAGLRDSGPPPRTTVVDATLRRGNRFANTLRNWGGAATAEVFIDGDPTPVIEETDIGDVHGYYWDTPSYGLHTITVRLRASLGSANFVDIDGFIRVRQIECP